MEKTGLSSTDASESIGFPLVLIGAGAGGLDAMIALTAELSADTGMTFIFLQEPLDMAIEEVIRQLAQSSKLTIERARQDLEVKPNALYVVSSDQDLQLADRKMVATGKSLRKMDQKPIDKFFISAVRRHKGDLIGVLLSGGGNDGTSGLKSVKLSGGTTFIQDFTAALEEMPNSAIAAGVVDLVLSPAEIGKELNKLSMHTEVFAETHMGINLTDAADEYLPNIIHLLKKSTGVDFTHYKISTIKRRIVRRMLQYKLKNLQEYHDYLRQHSEETTVLYHDLLINVTCFFRDSDSMEYLRKTVLPQILKSKSHDDQVRIWVPACSTGEEAYSLAILLTEIQDESGIRTPFQIFATDLSEVAIAKARLGIYSQQDLSELSDVRLQKYFVRTEHDNYRVDKPIRDLCVFAQHNVFRDPPFSRLDLISCCNLFIYLDNVLQQKCAALFYYALNPSGYLILGKSEAISAEGQQLFSQVEKRFKVYKKKPDAMPRSTAQGSYRLPPSDIWDTTDRRRSNGDGHPENAGLEKTVDEILYAKYIPAAVVINKEMEILQFRGSTNLFLEPPRGKASLNLMKLVRQELMIDLRNAIHKAQTGTDAVRKSGIELKVRNQKHHVVLEVTPLSSNNEDKLLLVVFEEQQHQGSGMDTDIHADEIVQKLQNELNAVRTDMQAIIDDHEAGKEELQSANEEIISSNEELQSINEELETSKEEIESANEELMAINEELQISNAQLRESQEYAEAIFQTIREAVVVLNKDVRVKLANDAFYRICHTDAKGTEGRLLYEIGEGQWNIPEIKELINKILTFNQQFDGYEMQYNLPGVGMRTMLVNGRKVVQQANKQELMLLAFEDITDRRHAELLKAERELWFQNMANNAPVLMWSATPDGYRNFFNVTWLSYTGRSIDEERGLGWIDDIMPEDKDRFLETYWNAFQLKTSFELDYRLRRHDGEYRWVKAIGRPTFSTDGLFSGIIGTCTEVHDAKLAQAELEKLVSQRTADLQQANKELLQSNSELQQFAYVASHDLQEPLRKIMLFSDMLTSTTTPDEPILTYINKIGDSTQRMSQLINDLLDFSRASRKREKFAEVDLSKVLERVLTSCDVVIKEKQAIIVAGQLPVLEAIPHQMEQLLQNLVSNSLKFSKPNVPPVIRISSRPLEDAQIAAHELDVQRRYVEIVVDDNGIGFSNEFAEQIFVLFQRLNARHEYPGTGIGLALCRKVVDNHGGKIFAKSIESIHTEIHIILPLTQVHEGRNNG